MPFAPSVNVVVAVAVVQGARANRVLPLAAVAAFNGKSEAKGKRQKPNQLPHIPIHSSFIHSTLFVCASVIEKSTSNLPADTIHQYSTSALHLF